jgi:septal ring factor EnvC (AmiA/AmiB activator)
VTEKRITLEDAIAGIESSIADTVYEIEKTEKSMQEKNMRIEEYSDLSIDLSVRIKKNRAVILGYLSNIYSEGTLLFNEENSIDVFQSLILSDADTDTLSKDIVYKSLISLLGQKFIEDYRLLIHDYNRIQLRIQEEITLLEIDQKVLEKQKINLLSQRDYRQKLLNATRGQEDLFTKYMD